MTRKHPAPGEMPLFWVGSSLADLRVFPERVREAMGVALSVAQFGAKHPKAKPWKGEGAGVFEVVADDRSGTYRIVYAARFAGAVYVLHAFQKKSPSGIRTARSEVDLVHRRLKSAREDYESRTGKGKR